MTELHLLGGYHLRRPDGTAVPVPQAKRAALLAYLAVARPHGLHRRDTLLALFWPELTHDRARNSLNQAIYYLRTLLGAEAIRTIGTDSVGLDPEVVACDVVDFEAELESGDAAAAMRRYKGPFLEGFHLSGLLDVERWIDEERARLGVRAGTAALALAEAAAEQRDADRAIAWIRVALPLVRDERVVRRAIELLDQVGDRLGALRLYESFAQELEYEYGVGPAPETEALIEVVRSRSEPMVGEPAPVVPVANAPAREALVEDPATVERVDTFATVVPTEMVAGEDGRGRPRRVWGVRTVMGATAVVIGLMGLWLAKPDRTSVEIGTDSFTDGLTVVPAVSAIAIGGTQRFLARIDGREADDASWSSSHPQVAAVDASGLVTGIAAGRTTITVVRDGTSASAAVQVELPIQPMPLAAGYHTCALTVDGEARCWGSNGYGQLGLGRVDPPACVFDTPCRLLPEVVSSVNGYVALASAWGTICAIAASGRVWCWGGGVLGELGTGAHDGPHLCRDDLPCAMEPQQMTLDIRFATLTGGGSHFCGLARDGVAYCWGNNREWALGLESDVGLVTCVVAESPCSPVPAPVAASQAFVSLRAGWGFTCGVTGDGVAHCWGSNAFGQLGNGTTAPHRLPTPVASRERFSTVAAGRGRHACALTPEGHAYCWGLNANGQLGDGSATTRLVPTPLAGTVRFRALTVGEEHTCGLSLDGSAHCWGKNAFGRLGDGTRIDRWTPVPVATTLMFSTLVAGNTHTCGIALGGHLYCWGENRFGALGDGTTTSRAEPVPVALELDPGMD